jgi:hypothetical protein
MEQGREAPLGAVRNGHELGYAENAPYIRAACHRCGTPRWVPRRHRNRPCRSCAAKMSGRAQEAKEGGERAVYLIALGKAAERAGLDLETLEWMAEHRDQAPTSR